MFDMYPEFSDIARKVDADERITAEEALALAEGAPLSLLGLLASHRKERYSGRKVFFNKNFHMEPTNICVFNCHFCSYRRPADSPEAWDYTLDEIREQARAMKDSGSTEVHIVGGVHPAHNLDYYIEMIRAVKEELPHAVVKAFSAIELHYMIRKAGLSLSEGLARLKEAGMEAIPGGGAEIFSPEIREKICPEKGTAEEWLDVHREAHRLGIPTNATILYGHIESMSHRIDHLDRLRRLQDETGGFSALVPLKYRNKHNRMSEIGEVSITDDMRMLALSRIFLDNFPHIKAYWAMFGRTTTELALQFGADDVDGTINDTTRIYSMAGAEDKRPSMNEEELSAIISRAGYQAQERDTFYNDIVK